MDYSEKKRRIVFICNYNRYRSPTARKIFSSHPALDVKSAGIESNAIVPINLELLEWADIIFVMESSQKKFIKKHFNEIYEKKSIICLNIADEYKYLDPELVEILKLKVTPFLVQEKPE